MSRPMFYASVVMLAFASIAATCQAWTSAPSKRKAMILRVPSNAIRIAIDDSEIPFHLSNIDQRFTADSLSKFIDGFVKSQPEEGELPCVLIESLTKRLVDGEDQFNRHLEQLATDNLLTLIYMPPPTGDDPNLDLRKFATSFKQSSPSKDARQTK